MYEKETITQIESARHDAAARDGYPHALWGAWAQTAIPPSEGDGSEGSPYIITKAEELEWFRNEVNNGQYSICAKIADNVEVIDMSTVCHAADASKNLGELSWVPIGVGNAYTGTFDGSGKTISNLYIKTENQQAGLFGYTYQSTIKNLTFENANVTNTELYTGILVGDAGYQTTLQNIKISTNKCQVIGGKDYTGGIAGSLDGNAYNCVNYAMVLGIEDVGGLFGYYSREGNSITACANYGKVTAASQIAGGLVGYFDSGTIQDCANYGAVTGTDRVAGMAGFVYEGKIQNVFSYGNVFATDNTQEVGMIFGYSDNGSAEGMVAYYSGAKLTVNSQEQTAKAFGSSKLSEDNATGFTNDQLKSGVVAYLLQQNASSEAKWGQNLANNGDSYPVIGSEHQVYADNLTLNCKTNEMVTGSFTNNPTSSAISYQHGQTINHHVATNATCTDAGTKEYWQCQDCLRTYSDSELTKELTDVTNADQPALGHHGNEDGYCDRCQHYVAVKPSEDNGVYLIAKPCHLAWFRDYVNGTIVDEGETAGTTRLSASAKLTADIDLKNYCHAAEDVKELLSWIPIGNDNYRWEGKMDGQGHTISNLYIKTAQDYVGLFGFTDGATIQDLIFDYAKVENVSTTNTKTDYTGILAGLAYGDSPSHIKGIKTTNNCTVMGQEDTGGIVGSANINLENCENHSSVKGTSNVGGIAGFSPKRNIKRCTNYGTVENGDDQCIGGIIGYAYGISIEDCANYGKITSTGLCVGGIAGQTNGNSSIQNVFSYGDVTNTNTNDNPGIIIGYVDGTLTAKGIVAYNKEALLNNSSENIKVVGSGSLTFEDGKEEADVVKAFTKQQIKSGEVAWLLNGSTSVPTEGSTLAWYQTLGENGDEYPVLIPSNGNTVYNNYYTCSDKQVNIFSNTEADAHEKYDKHDKGTETLLTNGLYSSTCQRCQANFMYIKDFCGIDGNDLELTANTDGSYTAAAPVDIKDNAAYDSPVDFSAPTLNYTRNFGGTNWTTWYVPFELTLTPELCQKYAFSRINNVHQYDDNNDGKADRTIVESFNQTEGVTLKANYPYLVRALTDADKAMTITLTEAELAKAESKHIECMSVDYTYTFTGIYNEMGDSGSEANSPLSLFDYSAGNKWLNFHSLPAQRHHLVITPRDGSAQTMAPARVILQVIGDETVTGIVNIYSHDKRSSETYDLSGRRVGSNQRGLLIKNGKKVLIK